MDLFYKKKQYDVPQIMTQAEFDALTEDEKAASGLVLIKDEENGVKLLFNGEEIIPGGGTSAGASIPTGGIIIWSGAANAVPDGWALCNGENGTPDLRDRFVLGAGTSHAVGSTGGSEEVTLTVAQMPKHNHNLICAYFNIGNSSYEPLHPASAGTSMSNVVESAGSSQPHPNMPPYYTLAYIMKL